jgi:hypothetical protein
LSSAKADPTYAVLDSNGNVTNIIVCGSACAGGTFGGNKVVLQVAPDPVTNQNRGGVWYPGNTSYNDNTGVFTIVNPQPQPIENNFSQVENSNGVDTTSSVSIVGEINSFSFKYEDTIGNNFWTQQNFIFDYTQNTEALVSVEQNTLKESLDLGTRKTEQEVTQIIENSNLQLLNMKIQVLIDLLGSWVK